MYEWNSSTDTVEMQEAPVAHKRSTHFSGVGVRREE